MVKVGHQTTGRKKKHRIKEKEVFLQPKAAEAIGNHLLVLETSYQLIFHQKKEKGGRGIARKPENEVPPKKERSTGEGKGEHTHAALKASKHPSSTQER